MNAQAGARGRAVDLWKTIGISVSNFHINSGVSTGMAPSGREISILAFEVANTISKVANLSKSLSEENIQLLKNELLQSEAIKQLISASLEELLSIAAADKRCCSHAMLSCTFRLSKTNIVVLNLYSCRQEFGVILREIIRFGNRCKDSQWHNLDQYFSR